MGAARRDRVAVLPRHLHLQLRLLLRLRPARLPAACFVRSRRPLLRIDPPLPSQHEPHRLADTLHLAPIDGPNLIAHS